MVGKMPKFKKQKPRRWFFDISIANKCSMFIWFLGSLKLFINHRWWRKLWKINSLKWMMDSTFRRKIFNINVISTPLLPVNLWKRKINSQQISEPKSSLPLVIRTEIEIFRQRRRYKRQRQYARANGANAHWIFVLLFLVRYPCAINKCFLSISHWHNIIFPMLIAFFTFFGKTNFVLQCIQGEKKGINQSISFDQIQLNL